MGGAGGDDDEEDCPQDKKTKVLETDRECLDNDERLEGKKGLILGWGKSNNDKKSDDLREVKLTVISNSDCMDAFQRISKKKVQEKKGQGRRIRRGDQGEE